MGSKYILSENLSHAGAIKPAARAAIARNLRICVYRVNY
jgi:hypothetical protein